MSAEPSWVPPANDRATWENDAWGRGTEAADNAERRLISAMLGQYTAEARLMNRKLDAIAAELREIKVQLGIAPGQEHTVGPPPNTDLNPVFDVRGHEIDYGMAAEDLDYPLVSTCRCGRQIMKPAAAGDWQHSD